MLYPRLKTEKPPTVTAIADGRGVKVESGAGTDYVFLSAEPFAFKQGDIAFEGTAGSIQLRGGRARLSLGAAGSISSGSQKLKSDKSASDR